jgi:hypothetical protein
MGRRNYSPRINLLLESVLPPLSPAQEGREVEPQGFSGIDMPKPILQETSTWDEIEIAFLSEERVQIHHGASTETRNYTEFGFEDRRSGKPNLAWKTLLALAAERGILQNGAKTGRDWVEVEKEWVGPWCREGDFILKLSPST